MNFKGTEGISREDLKVWIERAGGMWNGYTWIDQTTYFETLAADALDLALQIESERQWGGRWWVRCRSGSAWSPGSRGT